MKCGYKKHNEEESKAFMDLPLPAAVEKKERKKKPLKINRYSVVKGTCLHSSLLLLLLLLLSI